MGTSNTLGQRLFPRTSIQMRGRGRLPVSRQGLPREQLVILEPVRKWCFRIADASARHVVVLACTPTADSYSTIGMKRSPSRVTEGRYALSQPVNDYSRQNLFTMRPCARLLAAKPPCYLYDVGLTPYVSAWRWQQELLALRTPLQSEAEALQHRDVVLSLEHPHVYTLGRAAVADHLLWDGDKKAVGTGADTAGPAGSEVHRIERGGKVTYHGPGQLVMYPVLNLRHFKQDLHWYVTCIEEVIILALAEFGVTASRHKGYPGVWVGERKIAQVGMACSKWFTYHGLAINIDPDMSYFRRIVPCGIDDKEVTSLAAEIARLRAEPPSVGNVGQDLSATSTAKRGLPDGRAVTVADIKPAVYRAFEQVFGCELIPSTGDPVAIEQQALR